MIFRYVLSSATSEGVCPNARNMGGSKPMNGSMTRANATENQIP